MGRRSRRRQRVLLVDLSGAPRQGQVRPTYFFNAGTLQGIGAEAERLGWETSDVLDEVAFLRDPVAFAREREAVGVVGRSDPRRAAHGRKWLALAEALPVVNLGFDPPGWSRVPGLAAEAKEKSGFLHYVGCEEEAGFREILAAWFPLGGGAVAFVGRAGKPYLVSRAEALARACREAKGPEPIVLLDADERRLRHRLAAAMESPSFPRALFFESDHVAADFVSSLPGRRSPAGFRICGFDDAPLRFSLHGTNPFTTLRQDFAAQGRAALRMIQEIRAAPEAGPRRLLLPVVPVFRDPEEGEEATETRFRSRVSSALRRTLEREDPAEEIASELGLSRDYFLVRFKKVFGASFVPFLADARVERAAFLLRETEAPVIDVQLECGFGTHQSFARHFRRVHGTTPQAFRRGAVSAR